MMDCYRFLLLSVVSQISHKQHRRISLSQTSWVTTLEQLLLVQLSELVRPLRLPGKGVEAWIFG